MGLQLLRVFMCTPAACLSLHMCSDKCLPVGVHVCTFMRDHVLVCLFTTVDECVCTQAVIVCTSERVYESRQGVLNQF